MVHPMTKQTLLFEPQREPLSPPRAKALATGPTEDRRRLNGQCQAILARLKQGPATNSELAGLALKYTSRVSDLKRAGYQITAKRKAGGVWTYTLTGNKA